MLSIPVSSFFSSAIDEKRAVMQYFSFVLQCICLGGCSIAWSNGNLPDSQFAGPTAFGYWDDLYIYSGTSQTVYYGTTGTFPNRNLVFEFYTAHYSSATNYYRFQIVYYENAPGIVRFYYFQSSDGGASATIGVQGKVFLSVEFV